MTLSSPPFRSLVSLLFLVLLLSPCNGNALEIPPLSGRVNDTAAMLAPGTISSLNSILAELEQSDSTQIVVLTVPSLKGEVIEEYSLRVAETWGIGRKGYDNGALLLISRDDRRIRIEAGYGLEGSLTDLTAGRIIRGIIVPRFKEGRFDQGISDGVKAMIQAVRGEFNASAISAADKSKQNDPFGLIFILIFAFSFIARIFRKKKSAAAIAGGIASPILGLLFFAQAGFWLLALIPVGMLGGIIAASLSMAGGRGVAGGGFYMGGGFGGGFSGGGGGFGGGGASGGW